MFSKTKTKSTTSEHPLKIEIPYSNGRGSSSAVMISSNLKSRYHELT
jgi:hypothetical protein